MEHGSGQSHGTRSGSHRGRMDRPARVPGLRRAASGLGMSARRQRAGLCRQRTAHSGHGRGHAGRTGSGLRHEDALKPQRTRSRVSSRAGRSHGRACAHQRRKIGTGRRPRRRSRRHGQARGGTLRTARPGLPAAVRAGAAVLHAERHAHAAAIPQAGLPRRRFPARRSGAGFHHGGTSAA